MFSEAFCWTFIETSLVSGFEDPGPSGRYTNCDGHAATDTACRLDVLIHSNVSHLWPAASQWEVLKSAAWFINIKRTFAAALSHSLAEFIQEGLFISHYYAAQIKPGVNKVKYELISTLLDKTQPRDGEEENNNTKDTTQSESQKNKRKGR